MPRSILIGSLCLLAAAASAAESPWMHTVAQQILLQAGRATIQDTEGRYWFVQDEALQNLIKVGLRGGDAISIQDSGRRENGKYHIYYLVVDKSGYRAFAYRWKHPYSSD